MALPLEPEYKKVEDEAASRFYKSLGTLYAGGTYSDLTIKCKDNRVFHVHKAIVCARCAPFASMMNHDFLEASTGEILLVDDDPEAVQRMIQFLYTSSYDDGSVKASTETTDIASVPRSKRLKLSAPEISCATTLTKALSNNVGAYVLGDKYLISALKDLACQRYKRIVSSLVDSLDFVDSLGILYENTRDSDLAMKDIAMKVISMHRGALYQREDFLLLLSQNGAIGRDFLQYITKNTCSTKNDLRDQRYHIICACGSRLRCGECEQDEGFFVSDLGHKSANAMEWGIRKKSIAQCGFAACCGYRAIVDMNCSGCKAELKLFEVTLNMFTAEAE